MLPLRTICILLLIISSSYGWAKPVGHFYYGLKAGAFLSDIDGLDNGFPLGVRIGYNYGRQWSLEMDFMTGEAEASGSGLSEDVDIDTLSAFVTYRSPNPFYYLIRFGWVDEEIAAGEKLAFGEIDHLTFSYGAGTGYRLTDKIELELEYTIIENELDFTGLTIQTSF